MKLEITTDIVLTKKPYRETTRSKAYLGKISLCKEDEGLQEGWECHSLSLSERMNYRKQPSSVAMR